MFSHKRRFITNPWVKLIAIGFFGGVTGAYIAVFFLDFFNPLDLFVPPYKATAWSITCGFLGFCVVNSLMITEKIKRDLRISIGIYLVIFIIHSALFKAIIPGVGKLFEISGFGLGFGLLIGRHYFQGLVSRVKMGFLITFSSSILSFIFIGIRYFADTRLIFSKPIDLQIWFSWTVMCTWLAFLIGFEEYIFTIPKD
jgi:hypothetical protein